ncbi:hypothetical protein D9M71_775450 [compost metagenome]
MYRVSAPNITAVVPEPGTPRVSIGTRAPQQEAPMAVSGAARPRASPLPKLPLAPAMRFSVMYATALAKVAPAPGSTPMMKPSRPQRMLTANTEAASLKLNSMRPVALTA